MSRHEGMNPVLQKLIRQERDLPDEFFFRLQPACKNGGHYFLTVWHPTDGSPGGRAQQDNLVFGGTEDGSDQTCEKCLRHPDGKVDEELLALRVINARQTWFSKEAGKMGLEGFG